MASTWEIEMPSFPALTLGMEADVVIVGGGLTGLWCAYLLSTQGRRVILLERERVGQGATLYTTAFITEKLDTPSKELFSIFGEEKARLVENSHHEAINLIEEVVRKEKIDCEFIRVPIVIAGEVTEQQAKYHPLKFYKGLLQAAMRNGVEVYEDTEVTEMKEDELVEIRTKNGPRINAQDVILATYAPLVNWHTHFKKGMYTSYVLELEAERGSIPEGLYIDDKNPYHYTRVDALPTSDRIIVGGEDHRAELVFMEERSFKALEEFVQETYPGLRYTIKNKWQGGVLEPSDGLALIGSISPHIYIASAFSGNGMTYAALGGKLLLDLISGGGNIWEKVYDPKRILGVKALILKGRDYTEEFFGGTVKNLFK